MLYADRIRAQIQALGEIPMPSDEAIDHSECLYNHLVGKLANGPMSFRDLMEDLLYAPGLGYYSAGSYKIGAAGDFITAPEISTMFGASIANQCAQTLSVTEGSILEFGAGTGSLANSILNHLGSIDALPDHYYILELSPDLKQRQQQKLQAEQADFYERIIWLEAMPKNFKGVVLANEVLDAMPVNLFKVVEGRAVEQAVALDDNNDLDYVDANQNDPMLDTWWQNLGSKLNLPEGYISEVNLAIQPWISSIAQSLESGLVLLIDYGYPHNEYYHPDRDQGSLMCHYRHRNHPNPLVLLGLQDVTAHVDFTAVAEAALDSELDVLGYCHQSGFLTSCGILQLAEQQLTGELSQQLLLSQEIKPLIMPEEMGELFKVIALGRDLDTVAMGGLLGFQFMDLRQQL